MYFCIIASQFIALDFHLGGGGIGGLRVRPFHPLFKKSIKLEQLEILPFIFMFLKIGLADDIVFNQVLTSELGTVKNGLRASKSSS